MHIIICEDDALFAQELQQHIVHFFEGKSVTPDIEFASNEPSVLALCYAQSPDLLFMDIHLGGKSDGVEISKQLRAHAPHMPIIFVTSLENRAIDGYDVDAFGFVVKKHCAEKLPLVLEKLWKQLYTTNTLTITEKSELSVVSVRDILWVESDGRCSLVHTTAKTYTDVRSIQHFAPLLSLSDFVECFKSIFVNIEKIKSVNSDTITLLNDTTIPVSRRNRKNVLLAVMKKVSGR